MTEDLVERLRARADAFESGQGTPLEPLDREAADEIERLREFISWALTDQEKVAAEIEKLRAECEELRTRVKDLEGVLKWGQGL
jgi:phage shock protein A